MGTRNNGSDECGVENRWKFIDVAFQEQAETLQMFNASKYPTKSISQEEN